MQVDGPPIVLFTNSTIMGGMEEHVLQVGRGLVGRGFRVGVICAERPAIEPLRAALKASGAEVRAFPDPGRTTAALAQRFGQLVRTFRQYPGHILHVHSTGYRGADLVILAARLAGAKGVVRTMHLPPVEPVPRSDRVLTPLRDRLLDRIICVAGQNRIDHIRLLGRDPRKCVVIHNGIDLNQFSATESRDGVLRELGVADSAPLVGTVSRLGEERKGINYFVEMAAGVATAVPSARFVVVGEGELRPQLEEQARALQLKDRMIFTGARNDVPRLLSAMRVFVNPSLWEAGPYTVLEAAAVGVPVVSTPVGFVPEVIQTDGREGRLVPLADSKALTQAVVDVLSDEQEARKMADLARARVVDEFSVDRMVDRLVQVYRAVAR